CANLVISVETELATEGAENAEEGKGGGLSFCPLRLRIFDSPPLFENCRRLRARPIVCYSPHREYRRQASGSSHIKGPRERASAFSLGVHREIRGSCLKVVRSDLA